MYSTINFKTKKALREAVEAGKDVTVYQPNDLFGNPKAKSGYSGLATLEGPHYPKPHRWYATVEIVDGLVKGVK